MNVLKLIKPTLEYTEQIVEYKNEFLNSSINKLQDKDSPIDKAQTIPGASGLENYKNIFKWFENCSLCENKETLKNKNYVTASQYLTIRKKDRKIVGMVQLRHKLNEKLRNFDGNIGYSIRPSERGKGYAKKQLKLCLEKSTVLIEF